MRLIDVDQLKADYNMGDDCSDCKTNVKACEYDRVYSKMDFCGWLDDAPTVNKWIPCSERLPENGRQVLVYARSVHYALAKYDEMRDAGGVYRKQWVTFDAWKPFYTIKEVIAWMPLPEPYKGETR